MPTIHPAIHKIALFLITCLLLLSSCAPNPKIEGGIRIHQIQGCGHESPFTGRAVEDIPGIVTAKISKGFYLQDNQPDDQDCSSEGIFVFTDTFTDVIPGDYVLVSGTISEFFPGVLEDHNLSITEIIDPHIKINTHGNVLPKPIVIGKDGRKIPDKVIDDDGLRRFDIDSDGLDFFESLESMLIQVNSGIVIGPRNSFNEVVIIPQDLANLNLLSVNGSMIQQDDDPNPERIILNLNESNVAQINVGAELIHPIQGILDYSYGNFKINVFGLAEFENQEVTDLRIQENEYQIRIVSFNSENLSRFDHESRFEKLATLIVKTLNAPEIVVLHEIMDDSGISDDGVVSAETTIQKVINSILAAHGPDYICIQMDPGNNQDGGIGGGNIRSIILYRPDSGIQPLMTDVSGVLPSNPERLGKDFDSFKNTRKPLSVLFQLAEKKFLVIAAHLTSRGADSPLFGDEQPILQPEAMKRESQAMFLKAYVDSFLLKNPDVRVILVGDMNDVPWSETLLTLTSGQMDDLGLTIQINERYTYILDGNAFQMDYILVNDVGLQNDKFFIAHINSIFDQTLQISDHDPVIADISLP